MSQRCCRLRRCARPKPNSCPIRPRRQHGSGVPADRGRCHERSAARGLLDDRTRIGDRLHPSPPAVPDHVQRRRRCCCALLAAVTAAATAAGHNCVHRCRRRGSVCLASVRACEWNENVRQCSEPFIQSGAGFWQRHSSVPEDCRRVGSARREYSALHSIHAACGKHRDN